MHDSELKIISHVLYQSYSRNRTHVPTVREINKFLQDQKMHLTKQKTVTLPYGIVPNGTKSIVAQTFCKNGKNVAPSNHENNSAYIICI